MSTANLYKMAGQRRFFSAFKPKSAISGQDPVPTAAARAKKGGTSVPPSLSH